ncbi:hypothetical protein [Halobacillus sp. H74]|uniref:hypothetical protein n=1 Tax=Halobacillus sp. H74 TaxID=3457436 RepID=UPI003FCCB075
MKNHRIRLAAFGTSFCSHYAGTPYYGPFVKISREGRETQESPAGKVGLDGTPQSE